MGYAGPPLRSDSNIENSKWFMWFFIVLLCALFLALAGGTWGIVQLKVARSIEDNAAINAKKAECGVYCGCEQ